MGKVVNMEGHEIMTPQRIAEILLDRNDVESVVMVINRFDGYGEVWYTRQEINEVILASAQLQSVAAELARGSVDDDV